MERSELELGELEQSENDFIKTGLNNHDVSLRLKEFGYNEIKDTHFVSPFKIFLRQFKGNLIIYLLTVAAIISFFVGKSITSYAILFVILLMTITGFIQEYKAENAIKALKKMVVQFSIVLREGREKEIVSKEIVPGDIIILRNGDKIPADCLVLEERDLSVNESILTGESKEIKKKVFNIHLDNVQKYSDENILFMGSFVVNGKCIAQVLHTGMNTKFGQISKMISIAEKELPLQKKVNSIAKQMAIIAIIFSLLTGAITFFTTKTLFADILILVIALSVSAFPEGLPVVLTTALASGAHRMAKKNAIVNRMSIIETLGETTVICSDKTGTITTGEMTVKKIYCDNKLIEVSGAGYEGEGNFYISDTSKKISEKINPNNDFVLSQLIRTGILCNDAIIERTGENNFYHATGSPTESAILILGAKAGILKEDLKLMRVEEIPFNSERKIMSVMCKNNIGFKKENYVYSKGALEILLNKCNFIQRNDGIFTLTKKEKEKILLINNSLAKDSFRTIGLAYKKFESLEKDHFEKNLIFLGIVGLDDPPRPEVKEAIRGCFNAGIKVKMITGDNRDTAIAIARQIGLKGECIEGYELDNYTDDELSKFVYNIDIFARVKPEHKLRIVKALKSCGEIVTMTGDGVNDAPALKEAHIGVAMGKKGTDVSREVADLILKDDNFATIIYAIKEGRTIFKNILKFTGYQLSCSYAELGILFFGTLLSPFLGWEVPLLLALQILFMNLVTDDLPAITLAVTPSSNNILGEKPKKNKAILNQSLIIWIALFGFFMMLITLGVFFIAHNILNQPFLFARTTALVTLIILEIFGAHHFMSFKRLISPGSFKANKSLMIASIISLFATIAIIYTPLNKIFTTAPIEPVDWVISISGGIIFILIFNLIKMVNNKKKILNLDN